MDYEETKYGVYVKLDEKSRIVAINSSAFLANTSGWTKIDSGTGDKYHHAQNNYLPKSIIDENSLYNYKYTDGQIVERTADDKAPEISQLNAALEIAKLKNKLAETDYIAVKLAEGAATVKEYASEIKQRADWRKKINELEENNGNSNTENGA